MGASALLGIFAGLLNLAGYVIYNQQVLKGFSKPNAASWIMWVVGTTLNCATYMVMTRDLVKCFFPIVGSLACVSVFALSLAKGKFTRPDFWDSLSLLTGLAAIFVWWAYRSAIYANLILQVGGIVSFIPTYKEAWVNKKEEPMLPWGVWLSGDACLLLVVCLRWRGQIADLAYPVNLVALSIIIVAIIKHRNTALGRQRG